MKKLKKAIFDRNKTGEMIVKRRYSSRIKIVVAGIVALLAVGSVAFVYNYGLSMAGFERASAVRMQQSLQTEKQRLQTENQELREGLARAQRSLQMNETAYQELDRALKASAQEIVKLREELNFYRNIISPTDKKAGLRIQSLYIEPAGNANQYRYKLVLIQALQHERSIHGSANIEVSGMQAGEETVVRFPRPNEKVITVNFKYFQDIEGRFELPGNFKPRQVKVSVTTSGGAQKIEEIYAWPLA